MVGVNIKAKIKFGFSNIKTYPNEVWLILIQKLSLIKPDWYQCRALLNKI